MGLLAWLRGDEKRNIDIPFIPKTKETPAASPPPTEQLFDYKPSGRDDYPEVWKIRDMVESLPSNPTGEADLRNELVDQYGINGFSIKDPAAFETNTEAGTIARSFLAQLLNAYNNTPDWLRGQTPIDVEQPSDEYGGLYKPDTGRVVLPT